MSYCWIYSVCLQCLDWGWCDNLCDICMYFLLCLIAVLLPPGKNPFAGQLNNKNNCPLQKQDILHLGTERFSLPTYIKNSVAWVRKRTIPAERPPLVGEISVNFFGWRCNVVSVTDPHDRILVFLNRSRYVFFQVAPQLNSRGWVDPVSDPLLTLSSLLFSTVDSLFISACLSFVFYLTSHFSFPSFTLSRA
jgi:hypothetical protein